MKTLLVNTKTLRQILEEAMSLLKMFWRAALPSIDGPAQYLQKVSASASFSLSSHHSISVTITIDSTPLYVYVQEQMMKEEIQSLRMRIAEQEEVLQNTIQRLRSTSRTKESMETFIVSQRQSRPHDTTLRNGTLADDDTETSASRMLRLYIRNLVRVLLWLH